VTLEGTFTDTTELELGMEPDVDETVESDWTTPEVGVLFCKVVWTVSDGEMLVIVLLTDPDVGASDVIEAVEADASVELLWIITAGVVTTMDDVTVAPPNTGDTWEDMEVERLNFSDDNRTPLLVEIPGLPGVLDTSVELEESEELFGDVMPDFEAVMKTARQTTRAITPNTSTASDSAQQHVLSVIPYPSLATLDPKYWTGFP